MQLSQRLPKRRLQLIVNLLIANSPAAPVALKCMCELLKEKSQFNFATNILEVLVKTLGRRKFNNVSTARTLAKETFNATCRSSSLTHTIFTVF